MKLTEKYLSNSLRYASCHTALSLRSGCLTGIRKDNPRGSELSCKNWLVNVGRDKLWLVGSVEPPRPYPKS